MLYTTYRPQTLSEVVGQTENILTLKKQIAQNKFDSAYLFAGHRGTGKTSIAVFLHELFVAKLQPKTDLATNVKVVVPS